MKRLVTVLLCLAMSLALFAGCLGMDDPVESMIPDMGQNDTNNNNQTQTPDNQNNNQQQAQPNVDTSKFIGEEKAKEMALSKAGIMSADGVMFERVDLDSDDGVWCYEVEFKKDNIEYDIKVKADDGAILEYEKDTKD